MMFELNLESRKSGCIVMRRAKDDRVNIHSEAFWVRCNNFLHIVEPTLIAL